MNDVAKYLKEHGIRPSVQRIAIMDYLLTHKTHPTVDEIHSALAPVIPMLSKTTVYNTMRVFAENNAMLWLNIDDKQVHADGDTSHHIHFFCTRCDKIYDIHTDEVPGSEDLYLHQIGEFVVNETHIYYKGICKNCLDKTDY